MIFFSIIFHGLLFIAVLALSTLTFGRGPYVPTIYQVELVSLSAQPLALPSRSSYITMPSAPEPPVVPPVVDSTSEPAIILPKQSLEKKKIAPEKITKKRVQEEVPKPSPKKKKPVLPKKKPVPPKREVSLPKKKTEPPTDTSKKLKEIQKRLADAQRKRPGEQAKSPPNDKPDIQILTGPSGGSLLGRAHFGAVANLRMKIYLNQVRERIESVLVWPSTLDAEKDWITLVSIRILRDGIIERVQIEEKSGNSFFDDAVLRAIKKAGPLPPLPDTYRENTLEILCAFHSKKGR
ncbi:MAG: TonB C-terminal domain-containing protein [Deltaproteobacteria bacterium]|nr:TonB C-terminal domain-containing protein [Deltaproteobacteria bacterium]MBW2308052.1 TonB C-terminal domain-containing protein [Deltaproteobacteria bacterium]